MIITAKKLRPRRLAAACALAFVALGALGATLNLAQDIQTAQVVLPLQADPRNVKSNEDRVAYLEGCGWLVGEEAVSQEDIRLPDAFDGAYADYLALQSAQGFDLTQYGRKDRPAVHLRREKLPRPPGGHLGQPAPLPGPGHRRGGLFQRRGRLPPGAGLSDPAMTPRRAPGPPRIQAGKNRPMGAVFCLTSGG